MKQEDFKFIGWMIFSAIALFSTVFMIKEYFATSADVEVIKTEVKVEAADKRVFQQEQAVQQLRAYQIFEQRQEQKELTPMEAEVIEEAEERLSELKEVRKRRLDEYEQMKRKK